MPTYAPFFQTLSAFVLYPVIMFVYFQCSFTIWKPKGIIGTFEWFAFLVQLIVLSVLFLDYKEKRKMS